MVSDASMKAGAGFFADMMRRPVAVTLLTLGLTLAGMLGFGLLPVSPLPQVEFPTISVSANMPGASPETMASSVAAPLERSFASIAGITEMTSSNSLGSTRIVLQFDLSRSIDGAARDVQAAINASRSLLPTALTGAPTYRKVNPADAPIMLLTLTSDSMTRAQMFDAASTILAQKIAQVKGVGQVSVGGGSLPAVRVAVDPQKLSSLGLGMEDVRLAIAGANANRPKGVVEDDQQRWQIQANDQALKAADYMPVVIGYKAGAAIRMQDVAQVQDGVQDRRNDGLANGVRAVSIVINRQPGANIIETVDNVRALIPQLQAQIPAAMTLKVEIDRTPTIRASLKEVERSLVISVALVVMSVFIFLRHWRAAVVPLVVVPVSLVGTFAFMYLMGFSLNNLSLMALTIATGFVVDDAVVVLENISRHIEEGQSPLQAAIQGTREVGFTVVSISLSLIAVFIPILLMGGIIGRLFREFAVTLSVAILVSMVVSLTTTSVLCSRVLRPPRTDRHGALYTLSERFFQALQSGYAKSLDWALKHRRITALSLLATMAFNVYLYGAVPKGFFPQQDTGRMFGFIQADQSASFQNMQKKLARIVDIIQRDPDVDTVVGFTGTGSRNGGQVFIALKPLGERTLSAEKVIGRLRGKLGKEPGASVYLSAVQDIRIGGRPSNAQYQYTLQSDSLEELRLWEPRIRRALSTLKELADVNTDAQDKGIQTLLTVDRDEAARLGLSPRVVSTALNNWFGQRLVSTMYMPLNQYRVVLEADPSYSQSPDSLKDMVLIAPGGVQVPLMQIAQVQLSASPLSISHQGAFVADTISFNLPDGVSLSQATVAIKEAMDKIGVPATITGGFEGNAKVFQQSLSSQPLLIGLALLTVYLVLGILYESFAHPLTILSTLPSAGVGALLALLAFDTEFSIIAMIGVILLIGIVKKNAILMIDVAIVAQRDEGLSAVQAIRKACLQRLRPILMTTVAALFGAIPLALGVGDGAELRQPLGISVVGGLMLSQLLTLYTTPVVYVYVDRMQQAVRRLKNRWGQRGAAPITAEQGGA